VRQEQEREDERDGLWIPTAQKGDVDDINLALPRAQEPTSHLPPIFFWLCPRQNQSYTPSSLLPHLCPSPRLSDWTMSGPPASRCAHPCAHLWLASGVTTPKTELKLTASFRIDTHGARDGNGAATAPKAARAAAMARWRDRPGFHPRIRPKCAGARAGCCSLRHHRVVRRHEAANSAPTP
jgi:hypothetical protein